MNIQDIKEGKLKNLSEANLYRAKLSGANLSGANLSGADLSEADLYRANLSEVDLTNINIPYATISFKKHGECGRTLIAIKPKDEILFFCGCVKGVTEKQLKDWINSNEFKLVKSRMKALETAIELINYE